MGKIDKLKTDKFFEVKDFFVNSGFNKENINTKMISVFSEERHSFTLKYEYSYYYGHLY
ncbi:hypothetical protein [Borrelia sp. HM]|uniref:hypothetical protein n=1 Tax=Borrelia sp. HM TaxID=1882662 RepID=UPI001C7615F4|nr:hypothetical protein [Borrelia sp. HM]BCR21659.1 hypothetical protein BKFM_00224 [Borrelia sp. HM]